MTQQFPLIVPGSKSGAETTDSIEVNAPYDGAADATVVEARRSSASAATKLSIRCSTSCMMTQPIARSHAPPTSPMVSELLQTML